MSLARTKRIQRLRRLEREERRQDAAERERVEGLALWSPSGRMGTLSALRLAVEHAFEGRALVDAAEEGFEVLLRVRVWPGYHRLSDDEIARIAADAVRPVGVQVHIRIATTRSFSAA